MTLTFTIPGPTTSLNATYRSGKGRFFKTPAARSFLARIRAAATTATRGNPEFPLKGDVAVTFDVFFPSRRNDLDGPLKALLDGLQGSVYLNDRQVRAYTCRGYVDPGLPRVEVCAYPIIHPEDP